MLNKDKYGKLVTRLSDGPFLFIVSMGKYKTQYAQNEKFWFTKS